MIDQAPLFAAAFAGILGGLVSLYLSGRRAEQPLPAVNGKSDTVLFAMTAEHGLSNVHLATIFSLLENHPTVKIHIASFANLAPRVNRITSHARKRNLDAGVNSVTFHELPGPDFGPATGLSSDMLIKPPGTRGLSTVLKALQVFVAPWSGEDHLQIHDFVRNLVREIDPGIVVLDMFLRPAMDAARGENRLNVVLTPNVLADAFGPTQPWLSGLWKYPAMGSGHSFPVPWTSIPSNIYQSARFLYSMETCPEHSTKKIYLKAHGLRTPISYFKIHQPPLGHLITQDTPNASIPLLSVPPNVKTAGPIAISVGSAEEQDPELVAWLCRGPTVLVNLGSFFSYDEERARSMAGALKTLLEQSKVQVLWKIIPSDDPPLDDKSWRPLVESFIRDGRLRVERWLSVDPLSLLESGHVILSVHHGGANAYHEAVSAGVPQLVLPAWLDCYNYAVLAETSGIGSWGNKKAAPGFSENELSSAFFKMLDGGPTSISTKEKAKHLAASIDRPGRDVAADEIVRLAATGY